MAELYLVDVTVPGTATKLNPDYAGDQDMCSFKFSPDSSRVAYCAQEDSVVSIELYTVALNNPGVSQKLNPQLVADGDVETDFQFSADSSFVVYRADQALDEQRELYRVEISNPGVADTLNGALILNGDVFGFDIRPDDLAVVYDADQETSGVRELYEVEVANPGGSTKFNPVLAGSLSSSPLYSADGARALYIADQDVAGRDQLYRVDVANPVVSSLRLNASLAPGGGVVDFAIP